MVSFTTSLGHLTQKSKDACKTDCRNVLQALPSHNVFSYNGMCSGAAFAHQGGQLGEEGDVQNVFSDNRMCSLIMECVLLLQNVFSDGLRAADTLLQADSGKELSPGLPALCSGGRATSRTHSQKSVLCAKVHTVLYTKVCGSMFVLGKSTIPPYAITSYWSYWQT